MQTLESIYVIMATKSLLFTYCQARNSLRSLTRNLFWKYVNSHLRSRPVINSLKKPDDSIVYSDEENRLINSLPVYLPMKIPVLCHHFALTEKFRF